MTTHGRSDVTEALSQLHQIAAERQPDDGVLAGFLAHYYSDLPDADVDLRKLDDIYAAAVAHLALGRQRPPGATLVQVVSPDRERDGCHSARSVLLFVTDDVPFLIDTVRIALDRRGLGIHLLVHPMLSVERDGDGRIVSVAAADARAGAAVEAWTQIEVDRVDDATAGELLDEVRAAIDDVHRVVDDFPTMRERLASLTDVDPVLAWLIQDEFVFLGAAEHELLGDGSTKLRDGSQLGLLRTEHELDPPSVPGDRRVVIARSDATSTVHRPVRRTVVMIRPQAGDGSPGPIEHRFVGLLASTAYRVSVFDIPGIGDRLVAELDLTGARLHSHIGRALRTAVETLPRELVFELEPAALADLAQRIVGLQERQIVRVIEVEETVGPWVTVFVYVPRARFTAGLPERIADAVAEAYGADRRSFETLVSASSLARLAVSVRCRERQESPDTDELGHAIDVLSTSWDDRLRRELTDAVGEVRGHELYERIGSHAPGAYRAAVSPERSIADLRHIAALLDDGDELATTLGHEVDAPPGEWRFRVYRRGAPAALSDILPFLDNLGLRALDEQPYQFRADGERVYLYDIGVRVPAGVTLDDRRRVELQDAFVALMDGAVENDAFNRLVLQAGLTVREVNVVRAYGKYLRQIGFAFSQPYVEETLQRHPRLVTDLVALFTTRFDPHRFGGTGPAIGERTAASDEIRERLVAALDAIPSLDDDRICRAFLMLIDATVRTNYFRDRPAISFKLDPHAVPDLPLPRPAHEIWVCGPRVEGVHLRGGPVARGGLRHSDRREDFRTEVLGLMKAQMVKNAVIVPTGAKGGFVVKRPPADPETMRIEVVECYRAFVGGMLDITDNIVAGDIVHPPDVVVHDGDDAYLVVAADKGTATFSDIANDVSQQYRFWLGDAFASGGSAGYDHKAMGITARGAWESVRRHASVLGVDADTYPMMAVGIGDMSGDVFGNGMLIAPSMRLVAAFDHRHVFVDPDPDPAVAHAERRRLFELPRSSWADYDTSLISDGGGVYPRTLKSIDLSPRARAALDAPDGPLTPNELVSVVLRAPVDLLWNGGIGTYVKSSTETHADVGDRANDGVRVNGSELRCKMVGEGGNLGFTQRGRVEYDLSGGLIYTDAIDNSAGVDCSDHEVNIKILLDRVVADGELTTKQRNELLASMTDEVADLVLGHNQAQTLALMIARRQALPMVNVHARYIDVLEAEGWLDRGLEFLPTDRQIAERQSGGQGLQAPEFAVLIAYTKNANVAEVMRADLPDAEMLDNDLIEYFPTELRRRYPAAIRAHPLRREITTTAVVNQMVNLSGISFDHRMTEDTGASVVDVTRAWIAVRDVFDFARLWSDIDRLTGEVPLDVQMELFLDCRRMVERGALWLLRHRRPPIDVATAVEQFRPGLTKLATAMEQALGSKMRSVVHSIEASRLAAGVPESLAERAGVWPLLHTGFDLVEVAGRSHREVTDVGRVHWEIFERLDLGWLWEGIGALPRSDRWQTQARSALRDDLLTALAELTETVIDAAGGDVDAWLEANERSIGRALEMFTEIRRADSYDLTTLSVALRQLRNLTLTSVVQ